MKIKVIDVYSSNRFSFTDFVAQGYVGVIFKAGQGTWPDVPRVAPQWWADAKAAGLMRGWYWLVDARYKPSLQVEAMKKATRLDFGELGMWSDLEKPVLSMKERDYQKLPYAGYRHVVDFMYLVQREKISQFPENLPGTYSGPGAFELVCRGAPQAVLEYMRPSPLWTAQYYWFYNLQNDGRRPMMYGAWEKETWWQVKENPDINYFNGTQDDFDKFHDFVSVPPVDIQSMKYAMVTEQASHGLRVRQGPGQSYKVIDYLYPPRTEEVLDEVLIGNDLWFKIGMARWIAGTFNGTVYSKIL